MEEDDNGFGRVCEDLEILLGKEDKFSDEEKEQDIERGGGKIPSAGPLVLGLEDVSSEEDWSPVRPCPFQDESEEEYNYEHQKNVVTEEVISFRFDGKRNFTSLAIRDFWAFLEADLKLTDLEGEKYPTQTMPRYTVSTLRTLLQSNFSFAKKRDFHAFGMSEISEEGQKVIEEFIKIIRSTRLVAVNTEGKDYVHPRKKDNEGRALPLVITALGNLSGTVLMFLDTYQMPRELQDILSDVRYYKVGSGLCREAEELDRVGIKLRGWAESGALYRAFLRWEPRTGIKAQCEYLNAKNELAGRFKYEKYDWKWGSSLKTADPGKILWRSVPHLTMNVRVPIAIACAAALRFAEDRGLEEDALIYPVLWEGLNLVHAKVPEDLVGISEDLRMNWVAKKPELSNGENHQRLNNARELTFIRRAQADFAEVIEGTESNEVLAKEAFTLYLDPLGKNFALPTKTVGRSGKALEFLEKCCAGCGGRFHSWEKCPLVRSGKLSVCNYEHDRAPEMRKHSIRMCPVLHGYCGLCFQRGHHPTAHQNQRFTQLELRKRFLRGQPSGLLTCLPLLAVFPEGRRRIGSTHWRFGLLGQSFRRDALSRHYLGVAGVQIGSDPEKSLEEGLERRKNLVKKIEAAHKNAKMSNPCFAVPIPRFLLQSEFNEACKSRRRGEPDAKRKKIDSDVPANSTSTLVAGEKSLVTRVSDSNEEMDLNVFWNSRCPEEFPDPTTEVPEPYIDQWVEIEDAADDDPKGFYPEEHPEWFY